MAAITGHVPPEWTVKRGRSIPEGQNTFQYVRELAEALVDKEV